MLKKENGITLVALVVTIIILIILAAVSVRVITKSNIINYTKNGAANYQAAENKEEEDLKNVEAMIKDAIGEDETTPDDDDDDDDAAEPGAGDDNNNEG